jgi:hypothetical protein
MLRMQEMAFRCFKFQKFSGGVHPDTRDHCYPPLISSDKRWLIFLTFCAFLPLFISNTSIVSIHFGANLDAQNAWYIGHTRGLQPLLSPSNILPHRKVPFQKMPPPPMGKSLKKALQSIRNTTVFKILSLVLF